MCKLLVVYRLKCEYKRFRLLVAGESYIQTGPPQHNIKKPLFSENINTALEPVDRDLTAMFTNLLSDL